MRRDRRRDENRPGDGLGLSLVRGQAGDLAGSLSLAESEEPGGLRMDVRLPHSAFHPGNDAPARLAFQTAGQPPAADLQTMIF